MENYPSPEEVEARRQAFNEAYTRSHHPSLVSSDDTSVVGPKFTREALDSAKIAAVQAYPELEPFIELLEGATPRAIEAHAEELVASVRQPPTIEELEDAYEEAKASVTGVEGDIARLFAAKARLDIARATQKRADDAEMARQVEELKAERERNRVQPQPPQEPTTPGLRLPY